MMIVKIPPSHWCYWFEWFMLLMQSFCHYSFAWIYWLWQSLPLWFFLRFIFLSLYSLSLVPSLLCNIFLSDLWFTFTSLGCNCCFRLFCAYCIGSCSRWFRYFRLSCQTEPYFRGLIVKGQGYTDLVT